MKQLSIILLISIMPIFMGCNEIILSMNDSGKTITVDPGTVIKINLVSNSSTGNSWRTIDYNHEIIAQQGEPVMKRNKSNLIGAAGSVNYSFKALKSGTTNLSMLYGSSINTDKEPVKKFELKIVVK